MSRAAWLTAAALLALALPGPAPQPGPCPDPSGAAGLLCGRLLDLNAASPEALEALPGVGPARARALVEARPFASLADVERVPGIGPVMRKRLRPFVEVAR
ncbi:MAG: helix-hairpin-helix domain-containing protein [Deltaproteobacteria bacterium]|nr:helix-hairpin-helix domain-containing protein [Deltaproteobacteria bacterium]